VSLGLERPPLLELALRGQPVVEVAAIRATAREIQLVGALCENVTVDSGRGCVTGILRRSVILPPWFGHTASTRNTYAIFLNLKFAIR